MARSAGEIKAAVTMRMLEARGGRRHIEAIMAACEIVRRARCAKFPEAAVRSLEGDLATAMERWHVTRKWYEENVRR